MKNKRFAFASVSICFFLTACADPVPELTEKLTLEERYSTSGLNFYDVVDLRQILANYEEEDINIISQARPKMRLSARALQRESNLLENLKVKELWIAVTGSAEGKVVLPYVPTLQRVVIVNRDQGVKKNKLIAVELSGTLTNLADITISEGINLKNFLDFTMMPNLKGIEMGRDTIFPDIPEGDPIPSLESLDIQLAGTSIDNIERFSNLKRLTIKNSSQIQNLDPIGNITGLSVLRLIGFNPMPKLDFLSTLKELVSLELIDCKLTTFPEVPDMPQLEFIDIEGTQIDNMDWILRFPRLKGFWAPRNQIRVVRHLELIPENTRDLSNLDANPIEAISQASFNVLYKDVAQYDKSIDGLLMDMYRAGELKILPE